ncbi:bifunctional transcriptional activator/DNA repair enzyme AdaA [Paenilisteria rocourtiae]|uniref:AraC family transcriptional regulator of adaptative response / methylphosphotriester-DNA alkyltransferase methyltransferase n=1 Tax=Listeria rocourtiae TaxID=647910 RepID=A0A4R6ZQ58_9LIST|nr:bifunctional transcriptional activator/DNA repair enzyme AdaA [Listeria rocourtiae]EUJ45788.1 bifunctional transcriptional activator/DNA repair enzyme AdaA [Listeria rocourtiae FSL F6-920]MBC1434782.1 methylphosphotriester-DNA--protein-cysteine methyltransferase family protein [Listeria rocourtiae]MBC1604713.1 methylphosphotriester-DNA--protein-cysteine methyltransferase family protein [Listeria rocourtiae]TDR54532.1 AraC family transcriptional regulator of adaptative response / methylphosph
MVTVEQWRAICENDTAYDGQFFYAVSSTRIFCRPSCKSRTPKFENVSVFLCAEDAIDAGFRPCKRCKSGGMRLPDVEWVAQIEAYIMEHYQEHLTLDRIADGCHGSAYHLHRVFKGQTGMTPLDFVHVVRIREACVLLKETEVRVMDIGIAIGMPNAAQFTTLFKRIVGMTPSVYRKDRKGLENDEANFL